MTVTKSVCPTGVLLLALGLIGCATSGPPAQFYTLTPRATAATAALNGITVGIGPFKLPEYLNRPQMITRTPGAEIRLEENHRWAESLDDAFVRTLAANVSRQLGSDTVFEHPLTGSAGAAFRVTGAVQRFDASEDGRTVLEVQWAIFDREDKVVRAGKRARYEAASTPAGDFAARADALSATLEEFAADITAALLQVSRH